MAARQRCVLGKRNRSEGNCKESCDFHTCFDYDFAIAATWRTPSHGCSRYSSWKKLLRVTAYVLQFLGKADAKRNCELEAEQIQSAEELWIKSIQCQSFLEEVCHLMTTKGTPVPLLLRQFKLYLDEKGLMRCRGRIQNSLLNQEFKKPMMLTSRHHIVDLIIRDTHD